MVTEPITYIGVNLGPNVGTDDTIVGVRVVPSGRRGREVYGRTLNSGEPDTGEGITPNAGDTLVFPPGNVKVGLSDVDRYAEKGPDGYAPVTNTVWTWLQIPPHPNEGFFHYYLAASRRIDMAHSLCVSTLHELGVRNEEPFIRTRARVFNALGMAESMCIALNRGFTMIRNSPAQFSVVTSVPQEVDTLYEDVRAVRNAFEHIAERAMGRAREEGQADALSIFNQADLVSSGVLRYAGHSINLRAEVIPALLAARRFVYDVIAEAGNTKTLNERLEFGPFTDVE